MLATMCQLPNLYFSQVAIAVSTRNIHRHSLQSTNSSTCSFYVVQVAQSSLAHLILVLQSQLPCGIGVNPILIPKVIRVKPKTPGILGGQYYEPHRMSYTNPDYKIKYTAFQIITYTTLLQFKVFQLYQYSLSNKHFSLI